MALKTIRIVQPGWETFTGNFGQVDFVNGVSADPHPQVYIDRIGASIKIECVETGAPESAAQRYTDARMNTLEQQNAMTKATQAQIDAANQSGLIAPPVMERFYTEEELLTIAEKDTIKGLRKIGDKLHVKANSILALISNILEAQEGQMARLRQDQRVKG